MRDEFYIQEAFRRLKLLDEEAYDLSVDADKVDELTSFVADDIEVPEEPIIDTEAEDESELQDTYVGKVILECSCCHTRLYKEEDEVVIDEESGLANEDEECPVCGGTFGYTVIGKIEPYNAEADPAEEDEPIEVDLDDDEEVEEPEEDEASDEEEDEDEDTNESFRAYRAQRAALREGADDVCPECGKNPCVCEKGDLNEAVEDWCYKINYDQVQEEGSESVEDIKQFIKDHNLRIEGTTRDRDGNYWNVVGSKDDIFDLVDYLGWEGYEDELMDRGDLSPVNDSVDEDLGDTEESGDNWVPNINDLTEEMLDHGNENLDADPGIASDDTKSLEDDQEELYKAAFTYHGEEKAGTGSKSTGEHLPETNQGKIHESIKKSLNELKSKLKDLRESLDDVQINTEDGSVEIQREGEKVIVDFAAGDDAEPEIDPLAGEMIAPLGDDDMADIEANVPEDDMGMEDDIPMPDLGGEDDLGGEEDLGLGDEGDLGAEEPLEGEEEEEMPFESLESNKGKSINEGFYLEEFDRAGFQDVANTFVRRVYENVNNYKINRVGQYDNGSVIIEGKINFRSGKSKDTTFIFESHEVSKKGDVILEGKNETFSKSGKAFRLRGSFNEGVYRPSVLVYNYNVSMLNESNEAETVKVSGRVKR